MSHPDQCECGLIGPHDGCDEAWRKDDLLDDRCLGRELGEAAVMEDKDGHASA